MLTLTIFIIFLALLFDFLNGMNDAANSMGMLLTHLRPSGGFCAETAAASVLIGTALGGIPVSTTHTITGAIMGVGSVRRLSAVRWGIAGKRVKKSSRNED